MRPILIALSILFAGAAAAQQPDLSQSGLVGNLEKSDDPHGPGAVAQTVPGSAGRLPNW